MKRELLGTTSTGKPNLVRAADYVSRRLIHCRWGIVFLALALAVSAPILVAIGLGEWESEFGILLIVTNTIGLVGCLFLSGWLISKDGANEEDIKKIACWAKGTSRPGDPTPPSTRFSGRSTLLTRGTQWRVVLLEDQVLIVQDNCHLTVLWARLFQIDPTGDGKSQRSTTRVTVKMGCVTERTRVASAFVREYQRWQEHHGIATEETEQVLTRFAAEKDYGGIGRLTFALCAAGMLAVALPIQLTGASEILNVNIAAIGFCLLMVPFACSRSQNMGYSRSLGWLMLFPFVNLLLVAGCCMRPEGYADR